MESHGKKNTLHLIGSSNSPWQDNQQTYMVRFSSSTSEKLNDSSDDGVVIAEHVIDLFSSGATNWSVSLSCVSWNSKKMRW